MIPFRDLKAQYYSIKDETDAAVVNEVLSLPIYAEPTDAQIETASAAVGEGIHVRKRRN